jgi:hypothetical protein
MITCGGVRKMWGKPVESCGKFWEIIWEKNVGKDVGKK